MSLDITVLSVQQVYLLAGFIAAQIWSRKQDQ